MVKAPSFVKSLPGVVIVVALLSGCASGGASPDSPTSTGYEYGSDNQMQALVTCMQDRGWDATYDEVSEGMLVQGVDEAQREQNEIDDAACMSEVGMDVPPPELTDEQLTEIYEHELVTAGCLRGLGVDVSEAPSESVFKETYEGGTGWSAYRDVGAVPEETWNEYNRTCPQTPENE